MKYVNYWLVVIVPMLLFQSCTKPVYHSSLKLSQKECLGVRYGHVINGTLHSRKTLLRRFERRTQAMLPQSQAEALTILQKRYPELNIREITFIIKHCEGFYQSQNGRKVYLFDPIKLIYLKNEEIK